MPVPPLAAGEYLRGGARYRKGVIGARTAPFAPRFNVRLYRSLTILTVSIFAAYLVYRALTDAQPATTDEAHAILYGAWVLRAPSPAAGSFGWTVGSSLWPVIAASAYTAGGLPLARVCAATFGLIGFIATIDTARQLFDEVASLWAAVTLSICGVLIQRADSATPELLAFAGIGVSAWGIARAIRRDNRAWLAVAGAAFALALLASYSALLCLIPLITMLLALRLGRRNADLYLFIWIAVATLVTYILPSRPALEAALGGDATVGVNFAPPSGAVLESILLWYAMPAIMGLGELIIAKGRRRATAILLLGLGLGPVYLIANDSWRLIGRSALLGYIFAYLLIGFFLAEIWGAGTTRLTLAGIAGALGKRVGVLLIIAILATVGYAQIYDLDISQQNSAPVVAYTTAHIQPGDRVLVAVMDPVVLALYERGNISSLDDVYDLTRAQESGVNPCSLDWVIAPSDQPWSSLMQAQITSCGLYAKAYSGVITTQDIGPGWSVRSRREQVTVYVNVFRANHS